MIFTDANLIRLLFTFWLAAHIAHLIAFIFANLDDIFISKVFFLGDLAGWGLVCGVTLLLINVWHAPRWILWVYYAVHILIVSTVFSDLALYQDSISLTNLKALIRETLIESLLIPWGVGIAVGVISAVIFGL
ncbi:MAG: hypothetical protein DRO88_07460 [Promethearchaeia archaeon]|nr:MAG: hypothetical protein DRO88_07460 [Candidatus Lokiarchaeia archaeon]